MNIFEGEERDDWPFFIFTENHRHLPIASVNDPLLLSFRVCIVRDVLLKPRICLNVFQNNFELTFSCQSIAFWTNLISWP